MVLREVPSLCRNIRSCANLHLLQHIVPALVHLVLLVRDKVVLALKEPGAFLAVEFAQARQIFYGLRILVLCEVLLVVQVGVDLVEIARVPARLLFGVLSSDGRHGGWSC
jgi:hypothetical protein